MKVFNPQVLDKLMYEAPDRTNQTLKKVAKKMGGITDKYLSRQLNPDDPGAKVGIEDFVYFLAVTDLAPLDYIEQAFDRISIPIPTNKYDDRHVWMDTEIWLHHIGSIVLEAGEAVSTLAEAVADGKITDKEKEKCRQEVYEALQALAAAWAKLKNN